MQLTITNRLPKSLSNACYLYFLFDDAKFKGQARKFDTAQDGLLKRLFNSGDFTGKTGRTLTLHGLDGAADTRHILIGLGSREQADASAWRTACTTAAKQLINTPASMAICDCLTSVANNTLTAPEMAAHLVREIGVASYTFELHTSVKPSDENKLKQLILHCSKELTEQTNQIAHEALSTANGMAVARTLGNLAPNICNPEFLANQAIDMASQFDNFSTQILDEAEMQELGMGAMLSVCAGSEQPGRMIVMNYQGKKRSGKPIVLIGKGVTFDTGGISIKSSTGMDEMKFDMCGAASVFGVMHSLGELQPAINVIGIVAAAENMPDGRASRPGDVITTMSGKTVEILNTDAEGRLVLCDALTYSKRFEPSVVIDIATLTGAAVVALGHHMSAVFGNHQATIDALVESGEVTGDRTWPMPMSDQYQKQLDSNFADMANIGGSSAGAITAACFLARFAEDLQWAHLDIAGIAWHSGKNKGATGRPVPLLLNYINRQINS